MQTRVSLFRLELLASTLIVAMPCHIEGGLEQLALSFTFSIAVSVDSGSLIGPATTEPS